MSHITLKQKRRWEKGARSSFSFSLLFPLLYDRARLLCSLLLCYDVTRLPAYPSVEPPSTSKGFCFSG